MANENSKFKLPAPASAGPFLGLAGLLNIPRRRQPPGCRAKLISRLLSAFRIATAAFRRSLSREGLVQVEIEGPVSQFSASAAPVPLDDTTPEGSSGSLFDFIGECYLDFLSRELEAKHPFALLIRDNLHWIFLEAEAKKSLLDEGVTLGDDAASTLALRTRMAELTDTYGPAMTGKTRAEAVSGQIAIERGHARSSDVDLNLLAAWQPPGGNPI